jgi:outer membrane receptor protein involved in Fe transport
VKSGAVVEVQSSVARRERWNAGVDLGAGSSDTGSARTSVGGPLSKRIDLGASLAGERSSRFLDPVHPDNFHNTGGVLSGSTHLSFLSSAGDIARINAGAGRSRFDVPHNEEQEVAGQDQRQRLTQQSFSGSWQRAWSDRTISQVAVHRRSIDAQLLGSPEDTPLTATSDRYQSRTGVLASITHDKGRHTMKAGADVARVQVRENFAFAVTDDDEAEEAGLSEGAMAFTPDAPFEFHDRASRMQWALFAQDRIRVADDITVDLGLRFDRTRLLVDAWQLSPRAGVAYRWPGSTTTLRASVNRLFQPPQPEHLLLSSSAAARALSPFVHDDDEFGRGGALAPPSGDSVEAGGAAIEPERQTAVEVGAEHWFARVLRLDVAYWRRQVENYSDPNVFFGTTIVFPNSVASGRAHGLDVRLEIPRYRSLSGYVSYGLSHVEQVGPINGGLFLEDEAIEIGPGVTFTPDHDQRHIAAAGLTFTTSRGFSASVATRYASGTPLEVEAEQESELAERPGADLVDFDRGRVRPRTVVDLSAAQKLWTTSGAEVSLRFTVTNLTNTRYAFNFGNPFSGTHFGAPRAAIVEVHVGAR